MNEEIIKSLGFDKVRKQLEDLCVTESAKFMARNLLPYDNIELAERAIHETTQGRDFYKQEGALPFLEFVGIYPIIDRIKVLSPISGEELLQTASVLETIGEIKKMLYSCKDDFPLLSHYSNSLKKFTGIVSKIRLAIGPDGKIVDSASPLISILRREIYTTHMKIQTILQRIIYSKQYENIVQDQIITTRNGRYVIPIKQSGKTNFSCVVQDESSSRLTLFVEPLSVVELNNKLREISLKEKQEEERIIIEIEKETLARMDDLLSSLNVIEKLDFIFAKGKLSIFMDGNEVTLTDRKKIRIVQGRHPFIQKNSVVPIDVEIGDSSGYHMLIITGPNTGGKTVTLKTTGLFVLMAESGLHLPAYSNSEIGFYKDVFADIGDEQSIQQSLSTFSSHIKRIINILLNANKDSLVLLDELGAGTDPEEGSALGYAILKDLYNRNIITLASTHHSKLKEFPYEFTFARNASVGFDVETLQPTYKLYIGVPGGSHALIIAEKLGMPEKVLSDSRRELSEEHAMAQEMLSKISLDREKIDKSKVDIENNQKEVETLKEIYTKKLEDLENRKKEEIKKAHNEAQKIVEDTQSRMDNIMNNLENYIKSQKAVQEVKKQVKEKGEEIEEKLEQANRDGDVRVKMADIGEGDMVYLPSFKKHGLILQKLEDKGKIVVQVGGIRATVSLDAIEKAKSLYEESKRQNVEGLFEEEVSMKLDLHGCRVEEAIGTLDKYLDSAYLVGLPFVYIVHGKGTGALRNAVVEYLRKHPHVLNFYTGKPEEGGIGATIVYLK
ncbi:MAG: endonuclease MutS2 [Caldisericota bacterium]|nr:endonuclease MutS2 [Caldisericota bacterium]